MPRWVRDRWEAWIHRSLLRWATSEERRLSRVPRSLRYRRFLGNVLRAAWANHLLMAAVFLVVGVSVFFLGSRQPWLLTWSVAIQEKADFLAAMWQVLAAALALSIAVVLFAFQSAVGQGEAESIKEFAEGSHLLPLFHLGLVSLLIVGLALFGRGNAQPNDWSVTWAVFTAGAAFFTLPAIFTLALRALDPQVKHKRRLASMSREVRRSVRADVIERIAYRILHGECAQLGVNFVALAVTPAGNLQVVRAERLGKVKDVRLGRLRAFVENRGPGNIHVVTRLGTRVSEQTPLMWLPADATIGQLRRARRIFSVG
jgi:hypothetical protein